MTTDILARIKEETREHSSDMGVSGLFGSEDITFALKRLLMAIEHENNAIYNNRRFVTGNIVSQQKEEEAFRKGWLAHHELTKQKLAEMREELEK